MIGNSKRFDKTLHQNNDPKSRQVVKEYFSTHGILIKDNPDKYGVDLISDDGTLQVEVEHRLVWVNDDFPYETVNLPERKAKYFVANSVAYVILSKDYSRMGIIDGKTIMKYIVDENLKESSNKFVRKNEYFYKIPSTSFKWVNV